MNWHTLSQTEVYSITKSSPDGLSIEAATGKLAETGLNEIQVKKSRPIWKLLLSQFADFMIIVLLVAAAVSVIIGDLTDSIVIMVILILNAVIGFIQEFRAERALEAIKKLATPNATVIRDGRLQKVSASKLVPGDKVILNSGDAIPADIRLTETNYLQVDESSLTGESMPVDKSSQNNYQADTPLAERLNMAYKSTLVTKGNGAGIVVATAMETEIGRIAGFLQESEPSTPLQRRLAVFSRKLSYLIIAICLTLFLIGIWQGGDILEMLLVAISLAVAAIPEALPAVVTIALALGARRLLKKNALIRKLPAVETLGSVTYICSDKTGTITQNRMKVVEVLPHQNETTLSNDYSLLECAMALNNDVKSDGQNEWIGDPTEVALMEFVVKKHGAEQLTATTDNLRRVAEIPFDSDRKRMTTIHSFGERYLIISKGAVEVIVNQLKDPEIAKLAMQHNQQLAQKGMRVLAFAFGIVDEIPQHQHLERIEQNLEFAGLVGMMDPPRAEVKSAIAQCKTAGIRPVMITGDHPITARAIAEEIGIWTSDSLLVTGSELQALSQEEIDNKVEQIAVYARVSPEQKLNIVKSLQRQGQFVAMTGDGVNDAPSLKNSNIGVAMGIAGTDVSKEAAHMILLDDNFATIVSTIREGRHIYDNIRKFIKYTMTSNSGEIWTLFLAPLMGMPIPLLPIHILWINLVTDGLPGLALTLEPSEKDIMRRPPRTPGEPIFAHGMGRHILWVGLLMGAVCIGLQAWSIEAEISRWQTMVFTVLCLSQLGHVLAIKSEGQFLYRQGLLSNPTLLWTIVLTFILQMGTIYLPFANDIFKTEPLSLTELGICLAASLIVFHAVELEKWIKMLKKRDGSEKYLEKPLTVLSLVVAIAILTGCNPDPTASCQKTTRNFINLFNSQDFRGVTSLFKPSTLEKRQINRMVNNLTYLYRAAGDIQHMRFSRQDENSIAYVSIHENMAMDVVFQVDDQCNLISYMMDTHFPDSLPQLERNQTSLNLPFHGEWYVEWGGTEIAQNYHNAHRNMKGAIDFTIKNKSGKSYRTDGKKNEDFYAYGQPVIAPCDARVVKVIAGIEDNPVGRASAAQTYGNAIVLQTEGEEYLLLAHLQSESIGVQEGHMVSQGDSLARCGNSGYSSEPHLHFIVQNVANLFHPTGAASFFDDIQVNGVLRQDYSPVQGELVRNFKP